MNFLLTFKEIVFFITVFVFLNVKKLRFFTILIVNIVTIEMMNCYFTINC